MLKRLKAAQEQNVGDLHRYWHEGMESGDRSYRNAFFLEVTKLASAVSHLCFCFAFRLKFLTVDRNLRGKLLKGRTKLTRMNQNPSMSSLKRLMSRSP